VIETAADAGEYGEKPVRSQLRNLQMFQTSDTATWLSRLDIRYNRLLTADDLFGLGALEDYDFGFLDVGHMQKDFGRPMTDAASGGRLYFQSLAALSSTERVYQRRGYSFLDVMKDVGGLAICLAGSVGMLVAPWANFQFMIKAMQKLYNARTKKPSEFRKTRSAKQLKKQMKVEEVLTDDNSAAYEQVYLGKLDTCEEFVLFLRNLLGCLPETALKA
jgi:hypothetical protein